MVFFMVKLKGIRRAPDLDDGRFGPAAFLGAAIREPEKNFAKYNFEDIEEGQFKQALMAVGFLWFSFTL